VLEDVVDALVLAILVITEVINTEAVEAVFPKGHCILGISPSFSGEALKGSVSQGLTLLGDFPFLTVAGSSSGPALDQSAGFQSCQCFQHAAATPAQDESNEVGWHMPTLANHGDLGIPKRTLCLAVILWHADWFGLSGQCCHGYQILERTDLYAFVVERFMKRWGRLKS
jgi:hypothetical protein